MFKATKSPKTEYFFFLEVTTTTATTNLKPLRIERKTKKISQQKKKGKAKQTALWLFPAHLYHLNIVQEQFIRATSLCN